MKLSKGISILLVIFIIMIPVFSNATYSSTTPTVKASEIEKAIEWALKQVTNESKTYDKRCLTFVSDAYQKSNFPPPKSSKNYGYATLAGNDMMKFTDRNPPRGAVVFYDWWGVVDGVYRNWGHVGISLGDGNMIHNLNKKILVSSINMGYNLKYRGWGYWKGYEIEKLNIVDTGQITAGGFHTVALKDDGTVWAWGRATSQRDDRKNRNNYIPVQVLGIRKCKIFICWILLYCSIKRRWNCMELGGQWLWSIR